MALGFERPKLPKTVPNCYAIRTIPNAIYEDLLLADYLNSMRGANVLCISYRLLAGPDLRSPDEIMISNVLSETGEVRR